MRSRPTGAALPVRRRFVASGATLAAGAAAVAVLLSACSGSSSAHPASSAPSAPSSSVDPTYGALPTFLPTPSITADSRLTGSPGRPAVTSQGDTVLATVPGGTVQAQVVGPIVPGEGLPKVQDATTCTWTVTLSDATVPVPIRLADFLTVDDEGHAYRLQFVPGAARPPATLRPGARTSFELRVVMATGEGVMRWQPDGKALAVWDFVVEND